MQSLFSTVAVIVYIEFKYILYCKYNLKKVKHCSGIEIFSKDFSPFLDLNFDGTIFIFDNKMYITKEIV